MKLEELLAQEAQEYARKHQIVRPGDIVMSDFGDKGIVRRTKIVSVSVELIAKFYGEYNTITQRFDGPGWLPEFCMSYAGQRLKKDGSVLGCKESASFLDNFSTNSGEVWSQKMNMQHKTFFNHTALSWDIENTYDYERHEYVC